MSTTVVEFNEHVLVSKDDMFNVTHVISQSKLTKFESTHGLNHLVCTLYPHQTHIKLNTDELDPTSYISLPFIMLYSNSVGDRLKVLRYGGESKYTTTSQVMALLDNINLHKVTTILKRFYPKEYNNRAVSYTTPVDINHVPILAIGQKDNIVKSCVNFLVHNRSLNTVTYTPTMLSEKSGLSLISVIAKLAELGVIVPDKEDPEIKANVAIAFTLGLKNNTEVLSKLLRRIPIPSTLSKIDATILHSFFVGMVNNRVKRQDRITIDEAIIHTNSGLSANTIGGKLDSKKIYGKCDIIYDGNKLLTYDKKELLETMEEMK